jgi:cell shape-determining protein MreD
VIRAAAALVVGLLAVIAQGAVAVVIHPPWCPDFALLVVLAIGLRWQGNASGLALVAALGYVADIMSGGLRGGHALLRMFVYVSARLATRQLNLRGALPLAAFAGGMSIAYGLAVVGLTGFFTNAAMPSWGWLDLAPHAIVNALAAPVVSGALGRVLGWFGDDEESRQLLSLESGRNIS